MPHLYLLLPYLTLVPLLNVNGYLHTQGSSFSMSYLLISIGLSSRVKLDSLIKVSDIFGNKRSFHMANKCPLCGIMLMRSLTIFLCIVLRSRICGEGLVSIPGLCWVCPFSIKDLFLGWMSFLHKEEGKTSMEGGAPLPNLGNSEGEEPYSLRRRAFLLY